jgi:hypothetical protein
MAYRCSVCGKEYQSRSGLRRHVKAKHRVAVPALPVQEALEAPAGSEAAEAGEGPAELRAPVQLTPELVLALDGLDIDVDDVLAYKVYHEPLKVVIIEGPVGFKRVWCHGE